jgi:copper homeostasis protein
MSGLFLEVIACSLADAIEAARGGADRLELARDMTRQGLTPPLELVRQILREVRLPVRVMVRETDDFLCDRPGELERLCDSAREFDALGVDGIVVGFAKGGRVDEAALGAVLSSAPRTRATFHRAFDAAGDPMAAIETLKRYVQVDRVLSGGGDGGWAERCARLSSLAAHAHPRITILPGGGVDGDALERLARTPRLPEAHVGRAARVPAEVSAPVSAEAVRELRRRADGDARATSSCSSPSHRP